MTFRRLQADAHLKNEAVNRLQLVTAFHWSFIDWYRISMDPSARVMFAIAHVQCIYFLSPQFWTMCSKLLDNRFLKVYSCFWQPFSILVKYTWSRCVVSFSHRFATIWTANIKVEAGWSRENLCHCIPIKNKVAESPFVYSL